MKKKIIIGLLAVAVIAALAVWYFVFWKPVHNRLDVRDKPAIAVSTATLADEFSKNDNAASEKYKGKILEITGLVSGVNSDAAGTTVSLQTNNEDISVSVRIVTPDKDKVIQNLITVKGLFAGYLGGEIQLSDGVIIKYDEKKFTAPEIPKEDTALKIKTTKDSVLVVVKDSVKSAVVIKNYKSKSASVKFFSKTPAENIDATNTQVVSNLKSSGELNFSALIKGFRFENELMQDHFNGEEYMNSDKFPKAEFKGNVTNIKNVDLNKDGVYTANVTGTLTIHGESKQITAPASFTVKSGVITAESTFKIKIKDFKVDGGDSVAEQLDITVRAIY